jgi:hypothetical protein
LLERLYRLRSHAALDVVNELDQPLREWRGHSDLAGERHDDAELRVDLRWTFSHREVRQIPLCVFADRLL